MEYKVCSNCKRNLQKEQFTKSSNYKDDLNYICKECAHEKYLKYKDKKKEWDKKYQEKNKEKIAKYQKEYRDSHRHQIDVDSDEYKILKEKRRLYQKDYRKNNKNRINEKESQYRYEYEKQRRKNDDLFNFKKKIRSFIGKSFVRTSTNKEKKTIDILGCDFEFFKKYLNETFYKNYGYEYDGTDKVHIDHIIPLSMATTKEEVIKLCHYTNLQLLKAEDNIRKSNNVDFVL